MEIKISKSNCKLSKYSHKSQNIVEPDQLSQFRELAQRIPQQKKKNLHA